MEKLRLILEDEEMRKLDALLGDIPYKYSAPIIQLIQPHVKVLKEKENGNNND
jgi:hypothetical protein